MNQRIHVACINNEDASNKVEIELRDGGCSLVSRGGWIVEFVFIPSQLKAGEHISFTLSSFCCLWSYM